MDVFDFVLRNQRFLREGARVFSVVEVPKGAIPLGRSKEPPKNAVLIQGPRGGRYYIPIKENDDGSVSIDLYRLSRESEGVENDRKIVVKKKYNLVEHGRVLSKKFGSKDFSWLVNGHGWVKERALAKYKDGSVERFVGGASSVRIKGGGRVEDVHIHPRDIGPSANDIALVVSGASERSYVLMPNGEGYVIERVRKSKYYGMDADEVAGIINLLFRGVVRTSESYEDARKELEESIYPIVEKDYGVRIRKFRWGKPQGLKR